MSRTSSGARLRPPALPVLSSLETASSSRQGPRSTFPAPPTSSRSSRPDASGRVALSAGKARLRAALTPLAAGCFGLGPCSYHLYCPAALGLASFASDAPDATGTRRVWAREGNVLRGGNRRRGRARTAGHEGSKAAEATPVALASANAPHLGRRRGRFVASRLSVPSGSRPSPSRFRTTRAAIRSRPRTT